MFHVERLYRILLTLETSKEILDAVGISLSLLEELNRLQSTNECGYRPNLLHNNHRGRPRLEVKEEQLMYLLHIPKLQNGLVLYSLSTIRRRMSKFGFSVKALYSSINNQELDALVSQIKHEYPNCGYCLLHGHLLSRGHRITEAHARESLQRVDRDGIALRWSSAVQWRKYAVFSPLSL